MALSKANLHVVSEEESNFLRFANLVIRIGAKTVRVVFDKFFKPHELDKVLNRNKRMLEKLNLQKKVINKSQMDILFPVKGTPVVKSTDFDVTLMICLMRNIQKIKITDGLPKLVAVNIEDDLSRILYYRNTIVHTTTGQLERQEFKDAWETISRAVDRIGGRTLKAECDCLLSINLDTSFQDIYTNWVNQERRLETLEKEVEELQSKAINYEENLNVEVEEWEKKDKLFYVTTSVSKIEEILQESSFVLISGSSGMGKSVSAYHIALKWREESNYDIFHITEPNDILIYAEHFKKQVFIVDDFCGKFAVDNRLYQAWRILSKRLGKIIDNNKSTLRILGTCRSNVALSREVDNLKESFSIVVCDLMLDGNFKISLNEKHQIALQYFDEEFLKEIGDDVIEKEHMFPLLCSLAETGDLKTELFQKPYDKYEEEFTKLQYENEKCFYGIVLLVLNNNKINKTEFSDSSEGFNKMYDNVWEDSELDFEGNKPRKSAVQKHLLNMKGFLVKENQTNISTCHDKIFDFMAHFIGKKAPKSVLIYANTDFIADRIRFQSVPDEKDDQFAIYLSDGLEDFYFDRIVREFKNFYFEPVFYNAVANTHHYQEKLISRIKADEELQRIIVRNQWPLVISGDSDIKVTILHSFIIDEILKAQTLSLENGNNYVLQEEKISGECSQDVFKSEKGWPLIWAILDRNVFTVELLLNAVNVNDLVINTFRDEDGELISPLTIALARSEKDYDDSYLNLLLQDCTKINEVILDEYPVLHYVCYNCIDHKTLEAFLKVPDIALDLLDKSGKTPLFVSCEAENSCYVKLLVEHGCDVNKNNKNGKTPLIISCEQANEEIVSILLNSGRCEVNKFDDDGYSALFKASSINYTSLAFLLIAYEASVNNANNQGKTPLHVAGECNSNDIVQLLIKQSCDINVADCLRQTPLMLACANKSFDCVATLLINGAITNICDSRGWSPLHFACFAGASKELQLLIDTHVNINILSKNNETPLMVACEKGNKEIVHTLIASDCAIHVQDTDGKTALHKAVISNEYRIVELLVENKDCETNIRDNKGSTPLFYACENNYLDILSILIINGADLNIRNNEHVSPMDLAKKSGLDTISDILTEEIQTNYIFQPPSMK